MKNLLLLVLLNHSLSLSQSARQTLHFIWRITVICAATAFVAWLAFYPMDILLPLSRFTPEKAGRSAPVIASAIAVTSA